MPNWLHRTSKEFLRSVASADLPEPVGNFIEDPDLSAVAGEPVRYWQITGDAVSLVDQATRDAIDAAARTVELDAIAGEFDRIDTVMRAFAEVLVDEINLLRQQFNTTTSETNQVTTTSFTNRTLAQLKTALRGKLG